MALMIRKDQEGGTVVGNLASENSKWLREYVKRTEAAHKKSGGNKWIIFIIIPVMIAGFIGITIANGDLNDPQTMNTVKILGIVGGAILLLGILMIAKGGKKNVTSRTVDNLNELLTSPEEVSAFDEQMSAPPVLLVENKVNGSFGATKDYFFHRFSDMGNDTYEFCRLSDIGSFNCKGGKGDMINRSYYVDIRDRSGNMLMHGSLESAKRVEMLNDGIRSLISEVKFAEE